MAEFRTYRDRNTGAIQTYPVALAEVFPNLEEVGPDAKPFAYTPIPHAAVVEYLASKRDAEDDDVADEAEEED